MRKPVVDYREFRISKLNDPQFSHLKLLFGWVIYFALYFITEALIAPESCHIVHHWVDDMIPFCELFLIPYFGWYALVAGSLLYFGLYDIDKFKRLQVFIIVTQFVAMVIYILWPSMQDLRPMEFPRENILTQGVALLYSLDTNTNVCPSLHVAYSIGLASVWLKDRQASTLWKVFVVVAVILICLSTMFIKQHSFIDVIAALPVCLLAELIAFHGKAEHCMKK